MAEMQLSFYSHCLGRTVPLRAVVPVDGGDISLESRQRPLPALYLLHGLYGSENDWFLNTRVALWARQLGLAVFCPAGENSFYVPGRMPGTEYLRFIGEELPAFTRRLFPLSSKRKDTYIAGLSMGGFGALTVALSYPEVFSKVAALSAALEPWNLMRKADNQVGSAQYADALFREYAHTYDTLTLATACGDAAPEIRLVCGTEDELLAVNQKFVQEVQEAKLPLSLTFAQTPGAHTWDFWDREIQPILPWLLSKPKAKTAARG